MLEARYNTSLRHRPKANKLTKHPSLPVHCRCFRVSGPVSRGCKGCRGAWLPAVHAPQSVSPCPPCPLRLHPPPLHSPPPPPLPLRPHLGVGKGGYQRSSQAGFYPPPREALQGLPPYRPGNQTCLPPLNTPKSCDPMGATAATPSTTCISQVF